MTLAQAYRILGLRPGADRAEIEQAHTAALRTLQLQLVPGTPLAVRQKAQAQMAELQTAFELVKHTTPPRATGPGVLSPVYTDRSPVVVAGIVLAVIVVFFAVLLSVRATAPGIQNGTAQLRVLSVPWSYVEVDGTPLGPSGQAEPFPLPPGEYRLVLGQGGRVLATTISLRANHETIVKAQLEKGQIDVIHKKLQRASH